MKAAFLIVLMAMAAMCLAQMAHKPPPPVTQTQSIASLQRKCDSLQLVIKDKNFRLNRVKFYLNICIKHPNQDKFLKGWIKRAVN
jgi:hypothetical protein